MSERGASVWRAFPLRATPPPARGSSSGGADSALWCLELAGGRAGPSRSGARGNGAGR